MLLDERGNGSRGVILTVTFLRPLGGATLLIKIHQFGGEHMGKMVENTTHSSNKVKLKHGLNMEHWAVFNTLEKWCKCGVTHQFM